MQEVYLRAVGNLSLINHLKRMAGDGIRPLDMMIKAPSVKQEPHKLRLWEMSVGGRNDMHHSKVKSLTLKYKISAMDNSKCRDQEIQMKHCKGDLSVEVIVTTDQWAVNPSNLM